MMASIGNDITSNDPTNIAAMDNSLEHDMSRPLAFSRSSSGDVGVMDDLQFNASLDALLDSENLDDTTSSVSFQSAFQQCGMNGSLSTSVHPPQGLLTYPGISGSTPGPTCNQNNFAIPSLPYQGMASNLNPSSSPSLISGLAPYAADSLLSEMASGAAALQHHQASTPVLPAPKRPSFDLGAASSDSHETGGCPKMTKSSSSSSSSRKRDKDACEVSEDEEDRDKRRHDRNLREQQRSHKITEQIDQLRSVLAAANVPFKADKYSTLVTVAEYIIELQKKSAMLDQEHKKLIETISKTNEIVNNQYVAASTTGVRAPGSSLDGSCLDQEAMADDSESMLYMNSIDYKSVFARCGIPRAVASIDGRFMDCNVEFERLARFSRDELLPRECASAVSPDMAHSAAITSTLQPAARNLSLFNLLCKEDMEIVFVAMSEMLKRPAPNDIGKSGPVFDASSSPAQDYWSGIVRLSRTPEVRVSLYQLEGQSNFSFFLFC